MRRLSMISSPLLLLTGCGPAQSTFNPHGPAANRIATLSWFMTILFLVITFVMWVLIVWAVKRRRGTLAEHAPVDAGGGQGWIGIGGLVVPLIVLSVIFIWGLKLLADFPIHGPHNQPGKPNILITGHQWWWEVQYLNDSPDKEFTTANEIHLPVGRPINIEFQSADVIHSFWVPALHGKVDLIPGHTNFMRIEASEPGNYAGQCAEYCGEQHAHMRLLVVAQEPNDYEKWIDHQLQSGSEPKSPDAIAGKQLFLTGPCSMCHQVRGTEAGGSVAPDLTHIASRHFIAANSYPNNQAYLEAWITHAQSLKQGAEMPDLTEFTGGQLRDLVAYLRQLN
ncbi:MAG TPA: cytochrome c oxidase subunit II [Bryobacteraceae bacterium]|jgi:cytochrome c oxidase subunit 2|nr:cytochrome c oxidase subunit II [Bryobacteraceae bacterium]